VGRTRQFAARAGNVSIFLSGGDGQQKCDLEYQETGIVLDVNTALRIDVTLQVGEVTQHIEVSAPNDPIFTDLSQAMGTAFDDMDFPQMKNLVDEAAKNGSWVIFVGHEIGQRAPQTTDVKALEAVCAYLKDPANGIWLGTVEEVASYVHAHRGTSK